jgi:iron complex transport system substrate-binding protein
MNGQQRYGARGVMVARSRTVALRGLLLPLGLGLAGLGCHRTSSAESPERAALHLTDDLGRGISLSRPATRIVSLSPSNTEILFALGCGARIVLRDQASSHPQEAQRIPAGNAFQVSPEHIAGYRPDIVLFSHLDRGRLHALEQVGLAVASFDPRTLVGLYANIAAIGTACGAEAAAGALAARLAEQVARVTRAVSELPRPRVYIETDGADPLKPWTAGPEAFVADLLRLAGGRNFVELGGRAVFQMNAEEILSRQPDIILLMGLEGDQRGQGLARLRARPGWSMLEAVRRGHVIDGIDADLLSRPGPRAVEGVKALAALLHPEAFRR